MITLFTKVLTPIHHAMKTLTGSFTQESLVSHQLNSANSNKSLTEMPRATETIENPKNQTTEKLLWEVVLMEKMYYFN